jgi:hypothetical protein
MACSWLWYLIEAKEFTWSYHAMIHTLICSPNVLWMYGSQSFRRKFEEFEV